MRYFFTLSILFVDRKCDNMQYIVYKRENVGRMIFKVKNNQAIPLCKISKRFCKILGQETLDAKQCKAIELYGYDVRYEKEAI